MSLQSTKRLARTPSGVMQGFNVGKGDEHRVGSIHSAKSCDLGVMGDPLVRAEEDGVTPVHTCLVDGALADRGHCLDFGVLDY